MCWLAVRVVAPTPVGGDVLTRAGCEAEISSLVGWAIAGVVIVWFVGFVILGLLALLTRRPSSGRVCQACGYDAKRGQTVCGNCGYNFAAPGLSREAFT